MSSPHPVPRGLRLALWSVLLLAVFSVIDGAGREILAAAGGDGADPRSTYEHLRTFESITWLLWLGLSLALYAAIVGFGLLVLRKGAASRRDPAAAD